MIDVAAFNALVPVGTAVTFRDDRGKLTETRTRSIAWVAGGHTPVIAVENVRGCYLLSRVVPVDAELAAKVAALVPQPVPVPYPLKAGTIIPAPASGCGFCRRIRNAIKALGGK